jgi:hypothetical protein
MGALSHTAPMLQPAYGPYTFSAAHTELVDGELRPMDGHTYRLTVRLQVRAGTWHPGNAEIVQTAVNKAIAPLRHRTLVAEQPAIGRCMVNDGQVALEAGRYRYLLPRDHVVLLPIGNTTLDELAGYLLGELTRELAEVTGLGHMELTLAESPVKSITVSARIAPQAAEGACR